MNKDNVYVYSIKKDNTAILYRVYGNSSHISLPETIEGHILNEIGAYCFSASHHVPNEVLYSGNMDSLFELCGNQVESIILCDSIKTLGSHAFYNCRSLQNISLPSSLMEIGYDVFVNANQLHDLHIRSTSNTPTIIRSLLHQISWDIEVHFNDCSLFYPEYYEVYDEIGPAHIFGMNIQGEGFRLRQCIKNDVVTLEEFDSVFERLCIEESKQTLIHFALTRFPQNSAFYLDYILQHQKDILKYAELTSDLILCLLDHKALTKESLDVLISQSTSAEETTKLITWKKKYFPIQKRIYSFEDF